MSRWISGVLPDWLPLAASRLPRVWVARGSMPYSPVTHPSPLPRRKGGTRSSTDAVQSTRVLPQLTRQLPSAWIVKPGSRSEEHTSELQSLLRSTYAVFHFQKTNIHKLQSATIN